MIEAPQYVYVLTRAFNAYDQFGSYFKGVYSTHEKAADQVDHLGRVDDEDDWYEVIKVQIDAAPDYY